MSDAVRPSWHPHAPGPCVYACACVCFAIIIIQSSLGPGVKQHKQTPRNFMKLKIAQILQFNASQSVVPAVMRARGAVRLAGS